MTASVTLASNNSPQIVAAPQCIVCDSLTNISEILPQWGSWRQCLNCGLGFAEPLRLPEDPGEIFERAYSGHEQNCDMEEFAYRVSIRSALVKYPKLWFFNPLAIERILQFIGRTVQPGRTVFEIGAGLGLFMHTLRQERYEAVGLDVARLAVEMVRAEGFRVWHGTLGTLPQDFVLPEAIVSLFVLHHLEDPIGFLTEVRNRWPAVPIAIAEYGQVGPPTPSAYPPRTLHRWSATSLELALRRAGYKARAFEVNYVSTGNPMLRPISSLMRKTAAIPTFFRAAKLVQRRILPVLLKPIQQPRYTIVGFGEPN